MRNTIPMMLLSSLILFYSCTDTAGITPHPDTVFSNVSRAYVDENGQLNIEQYGITWTFDKEYEYGQFINGDYYVTGPVNIVSIKPEQTPGRNGSMINPSVGPEQGYDSRITNYNPSLNVSFPCSLKPGESLVSTISLGNNSVTDILNYTISPSHARLQTAAVLTCLSCPPPNDSFRPPYVGTSKNIYRSSRIRWNLLPALEAVEESPRKYGYNSYSDMARSVFKKVWLNHKTDWSCRHMHPVANMPNYHREIASVCGEFLLYILTDTADKQELLIPFLQTGIDSYHMCILGEGDSAFLKWPVLFTGIMLDEPAIYNVFNEGRCRYPQGPRSDRMTYYIEEGLSTFKSGEYGGRTIESGCIWTGYSTDDGKVPAWRQDSGAHEHEHLHPTEWADNHPVPDGGGFKREVYRRINSATYVPYMLSALIMDCKSLWNHDAFFDYVDRWMNEEMSEQCALINACSSPWTAKASQYQSSSDFAAAMWNKYREDY